METYKTPYFQKYYHFLNDFYSNDYDNFDKISLKRLKSRIVPRPPKSSSPFLPQVKHSEIPLTQISEEDFFTSKRELRKRDTLSMSKIEKSGPFKSPVLKSSTSFCSINNFSTSFYKSGLPKSSNNPEVYKKLKDRIKMVQTNKEEKIDKKEVLQIVDGLIEKYCNNPKEDTLNSERHKKLNNNDLEKNLKELDLTLSKVYIKPKPIKEIKSVDKIKEYYHLPGRFLCNIKIEKGFKANTTRIPLKSYKSLLHSQDFTFSDDHPFSFELKRGSTLNFKNTDNSFFGGRSKGEDVKNIFKINDKSKTQAKFASNSERKMVITPENSKNKFIKIISKMHGN